MLPRITLGALDSVRKLAAVILLRTQRHNKAQAGSNNGVGDLKLIISNLSCHGKHGFLLVNGSYGFYRELPTWEWASGFESWEKVK